MAIAFVDVAVSSRTTGGTTMTGTLPAFSAGDLLVAAFVTGDNNTGLSGFAGWTHAFAEQVDGTVGIFDVYYKIADGSETDLSLSWTTNAKPMCTIASYSGVDATTPVVAANGAVAAVNNASVATPTVNNTGSGVEWALTFHTFRVTSSGNKSNTFTPDAALTERSDANLSAAGSSPWVSMELADSNGAVTTGNHSYTATVVSGGNSSHKFGALLYLNPATGGGGTLEAIAGVVAAQSAVTAGLSVDKPLAAAVVAQSTVAGNLADPKAVAGAVAGQSAVTTDLSDPKAVAALIAGQSMVAAAVTFVQFLVALVAGQSGVTAALTMAKGLAALVAGGSTVDAVVDVAKLLAAQVDGVSVVAGTLSSQRLLAASSAGTSTVAAVVTDPKALAALLAGQSRVLADVTDGTAVVAAVVDGNQNAVVYIITR